jgi:hypothetical protein
MLKLQKLACRILGHNTECQEWRQALIDGHKGRYRDVTCARCGYHTTDREWTSAGRLCVHRDEWFGGPHNYGFHCEFP